MVENKKEMKKQKCINPIVYWGIGIGLTLGILALTGLFTDDLKIISFFVLIFVLYTYALSKIFPIVNIVSSFSYYIILLGFILEIMNLIWIGIFATGLGIVFQIVTLPVEFNASKRAKEELKRLNLTNERDNEGAEQMLTAAALTYVAGVLASVLQILRLIGIASDRN